MKLLHFVLAVILATVASAQTSVTINNQTKRLQPTVPYIVFPPTAIRLDDTDASHQLIFTNGSNLTANRTFTLLPGDGNVSVSFAGAVNGNVLQFDGTNWVPGTTAGIGTVTSVGMTVPTPFAVSGSPITGAGTFGFTWSGLTTNGIIQASSATAAASTLTPAGLTSVGTNSVAAAASTVLAIAGGADSGGTGFTQVNTSSGLVITGNTGTGGAGVVRGDTSLVIKRPAGGLILIQDTTNPSGTLRAGTSDSGYTSYAYTSTGSNVKTFSLATGFYDGTNGSDSGFAILNPTYNGGSSSGTLKLWGGTNGGSAAFFSGGNTAVANNTLAVFGKQFIGDGSIETARNLNLIGATDFITKIRRGSATDYGIFQFNTGGTDNWNVGQNASNNFSFYNYGTGAAAFTLTYADSTATFAGNLIGNAKLFAGDGSLDTTRNVNFIGATDILVRMRRSANTQTAVTEYVTNSTQKWLVGMPNNGTDDFTFYPTTFGATALTIAQSTGYTTFGSRALIKGDANLAQWQLTDATPYLSITNVNSWAGSGSTSNAAVGAHAGSLSFYTNGSTTAGMVLSTGNNLAITGTVTAAGGAFTTLSTSGIETIGGTRVTTANAMGALAIDVTKAYNTKTISADQTFTFSGTPANTNQWFGMFVTNSDASAHTLTIPSSFSVGRGSAITTVVIGASGKLMLTWNYDGSAYNLYGDPTATSGSGSYALTNGATLDSTLFTTNFTLANGSAPTTSAAAQMAFDTNAWAASRGAAQIYDGTANTYVLAALASDTPSNGQIPVWNTGGTITWETQAGGGNVSNTGTPTSGQIAEWTNATTIQGVASNGTGNVVRTSAAALTAATITTSLVPTSNDGAPLGNTTNQFSDLFLAEGGVINWDNGDATLTQAGNVVTLAGAVLAADIGTSTATTGAQNLGSTAVATTAYADRVGIAGMVGTYASPDTTAGTVTLTAAVTEVWTNTTTTYALPAVASNTGKAVIFYVVGTNVVTIDPNASEIIVRDGTAQTGGVTMTLTGAAGNYVCMVCDGTRWVTLGFKGTLAAGS